MSATLTHFASEKALVDAAFARLQGHADTAMSREAPLLGRSVDLAYYRCGELHTIEFKLHDWRRALRQATDHMLATDFAYICMPARVVTPIMREAFEDAGVGLLFYAELDWPFETVIPANRSVTTWCVAYDRLKKHIHEQYG